MSEATSVELKAVASYPEDPHEIINEGNYIKQVFNIDEIALHWNKMHYWTSLGRAKSTRDLKASKKRWTLLLEANASGDFKLKLMLINHCENPGALINYAVSTLSVLWNNQAWMTSHLFTRFYRTFYAHFCVLMFRGKTDSSQNVTAHSQCTWSLESSDGDIQ